jgi:lipoprotein-releasing system ATP-binding protein
MLTKGGGMSTPLLEARKVTRILPGPVPVTLVQDIDLSIAPGEFVAITGPSGSGKSSLLYLLGLLDMPSSGAVYLEGRDTSTLSSTELAELRLRKLGFVFQFHFLLPEFSVQENVMIPMRKLGERSDKEIRSRSAELLDELGMGPELDKKPDQLSGGQRQRAAIARAMANDPLIVLADEPTGNLDTRNGRIVFDIFRRLAEEKGQAVITVTHDVQLSALTQRQVRLVDGKIMA